MNEGLVDIALPPYMPTWSNNRIRVDVVAKRLDLFLVSKSLVEGPGRYRMRVDKVPMFDHFPIMMQLDPSKEKVFYPFKFKHSCEQGFYDMVLEMYGTTWITRINHQI